MQTLKMDTSKSIQAKVKKNGTEIEFYTGEAITGGVAS